MGNDRCQTQQIRPPTTVLGPGRRDDPGSDGTGIGRIELRDLLGQGVYYIPDTM